MVGNNFKVVACDGTYVFLIYLDPIVPSSQPVNFAVTAQSSTVVQLSWEPPILQDQNGVITGYNISVTVEEPDAATTYSVGPSTLSYLVDGLHPYTNYSITVSARTAVGSGPSTPPEITQTPQDGKSSINKRPHIMT